MGAATQAEPEPGNSLIVPYDGQNIFVSPLSMAQRVVSGRGTISNPTFRRGGSRPCATHDQPSSNASPTSRVGR